MSSIKKLNFALDNLTYNCIITSEVEKIQIMLPHVAPEKEVFESSLTLADKYKMKAQQQKSVVLKYASATTIRVFFSVHTEKVPEVEMICCGGSECKIIGSFKLMPKTQQMVSFTTINGGLVWHVNGETGNESGGYAPVPENVVTKVNDKEGPTVVLTAEDIKLSEPVLDDKGQPRIVTIEEQFKNVDTKIIALDESITEKVTEAVKEEVSETYILTAIDNAQTNGDLEIMSPTI